MPIIDLPLEQLRNYKPPLTRRGDFKRFWDENIKLSEEQSLNSVLKRINHPVKNIEAYLLVFDGFIDKTPVHSWLIKPVGEGPFPALLYFHGYGSNRGMISEHLMWVLQGLVVMSVDIRGQSGETPDYAKYPSGSITGHMTKGILDKNTYYYRYVYMDCFRASRLLAETEYVDKDRIGIMGMSQGGGLTLITAALNESVALALSEEPFLCHFERAVEVTTTDPYLEISRYLKTHPNDFDKVFETLSYFDAMNFAPDIKCPILMSVGLLDVTCPPSTVFATFNHIASNKKELAIYHGAGHEYINVQRERNVEWVVKYLLE